MPDRSKTPPTILRPGAGGPAAARSLKRLDHLHVVAAVLYFANLILIEGYRILPLPWIPLTQTLAAGVVVTSVLRLGLEVLLGRPDRPFLRRNAVEIAFALLAVVPSYGVLPSATLLAIRRLARGANAAVTRGRGRAWVLRVQQQPAQVITATFAAIILIGAVFLTFPGSAADGRSVPFITALFTSTSAVCVTGLVVVDTAAAWSPFGKVVILLLIQVGGLGIMTLSASALLVLGRALGSGSRGLMEGIIEETTQRDVTRSIQFVILFTFATEAVGGALLAARWAAEMPPGQALWHGLFHAVSAFCNAGFSTFPTNLEAWVGDPLVNLVVMALITVGGIGFPVAAAVALLAREPLHPVRWWNRSDPHTRLVLTVSGLLIVVGAAFVFYFEYDRTLARLGLGEKILAAFFQSVTTRTAGFNTVAIGAIAPVTATLMILWMFIGGSPGGTAGGIKTTTIGILALALGSLTRNREEVEVFARTVSAESVLRAIAVAFLGGTAVVMMFVLLLVTEAGASYLDVLFEAVSAFGTVGLSRGLTPHLTVPGQALIVLLMFVGRTGPLTLAFAIGRRNRRARYRYPDARIIVG